MRRIEKVDGYWRNAWSTVQNIAQQLATTGSKFSLSYGEKQ